MRQFTMPHRMPVAAAGGCDVEGAKRVWRRVGPRIYSWYFDARSLTGFSVSPNAGLVVSLVHISSIFHIVALHAQTTFTPSAAIIELPSKDTEKP